MGTFIDKVLKVPGLVATVPAWEPEITAKLKPDGTDEILFDDGGSLFETYCV